MNVTTEVLLVDDNQADTDLMTEVLTKNGDSHVQSVRDGVEAMAFLRRKGKYAKAVSPHLIVLDLNMPRINGFQVLEWLKEHPTLYRMPVAVMTSSDHDPHAARAYELGADSYLIKPPDAEALLALDQRLHAYWLIVSERPEPQFA